MIERPSRAVVEVVAPLVDGGRFAAKATVAEQVRVLADVFVDGHDEPDASLRVRGPGEADWVEVAMEPLGNDRWQATFTPDRLGRWHYRVEGWHARWSSWRAGTRLKLLAGQDIAVELVEGRALLGELDPAALDAAEAEVVADAAAALAPGPGRAADVGPWLASAELEAIVRAHLERAPVASSPELALDVDPERGRFSAWYQFFPRSSVDGTDRHATLADAVERLDAIAAMGFDVVYLPPIHPIGRTFRKGPNNALDAGSGDPGSPWAIGSDEGGHTAVHPELGSVDDVAKLVDAARQRGLALALDIAFQCSPDHPWVSEHPEWFKHRADGTIQYAENPPKKYQDIYPFDFETDAWFELWQALRDVFEFWIDVGVTVFRVDNPHTKAFSFWEWALDDLRTRHPETIFLAEAFTRPRVMERLAKIGFNQSYTYFTWRRSRGELEGYFTDLATRTVDWFRPNAWPSTPDILTEQLQHGGRPMFVVRAILAATLSPSWGIYGPAFELVEHLAVRPGSEEHLDSEKYQRRRWQLDQPHSLAPLLTRLNAIRRAHPALASLRTLRFHGTTDDALICYSKHEPAGPDAVLVVVNLDPHAAREGWVDVDLAALGLAYGSRYRLTDELSGSTYEWQGNAAWVRLDPFGRTAHVFSVEPLP